MTLCIQLYKDNSRYKFNDRSPSHNRDTLFDTKLIDFCTASTVLWMLSPCLSNFFTEFVFLQTVRKRMKRLIHQIYNIYQWFRCETWRFHDMLTFDHVRIQVFYLSSGFFVKLKTLITKTVRLRVDSEYSSFEGSLWITFF